MAGADKRWGESPETDFDDFRDHFTGIASYGRRPRRRLKPLVAAGVDHYWRFIYRDPVDPFCPAGAGFLYQ